jgi:AhpC/TSA family
MSAVSFCHDYNGVLWFMTSAVACDKLDAKLNALDLKREEAMPLRPGDIAPDFELQAVTGERQHAVRLSDYRGKQNVLLTFHPLDWTPT